MLEKDQLRSFCEGFYGYGEVDAPHWFISMEEGGGTSEGEIATRIGAWISRGRRELEDLKEYHQAIKIDKWFGEFPPIQTTWSASIRILLILEGQSPSRDLVRNFQRDRLARHGGNCRLSPLLPLPSKSISVWKYPLWTEAAGFENRISYKQNFARLRVNHLATAITRAKPRTVVFYGQTYSSYWLQIAGLNFKPSSDGFDVGSKEGTRFVICTHPAAQGVTNDYFNTIGRFLASD